MSRIGRLGLASLRARRTGLIGCCLLVSTCGCAQVSPRHAPSASPPIANASAAHASAADASRISVPVADASLATSHMVSPPIASVPIASVPIASPPIASAPIGNGTFVTAATANGLASLPSAQAAVPSTSSMHPEASAQTAGYGVSSSADDAVIPAGHRRSPENCPPSNYLPQSCMPLPPVVPGPGRSGRDQQEYLFDGGDREPTVQLTEDWEVRGLDSEDTIAHYETIDGKLCVVASNRVPIYAPRFGAVRKVAAPILAARAVGAERVVEPTGAAIQKSRDLASNVTLPLGARRQTEVKLIDGLRDRTRGVPAEKITPLLSLSNPQVAYQHLEGLGIAVRREDLEARLAETIINARTWTSDESVAVMIGGAEAVELRDAKQVQDVLLFESELGKCTLRISKAASHSAASPGDIVSFAIRFDNAGSKPIGNLVILDSLTTRLEYIDGSQQCVLSLKGQKTPDPSTRVPSADGASNAVPSTAVRFSTSENEAGSTVLRWEADLPLASGDSGVISFRCRVR